MIVPFLIPSFIFLASIPNVLTIKRWYYTGVFKQDTVSSSLFNGSVFNYNSFFATHDQGDEKTVNDDIHGTKTFLYAGGLGFTPYLGLGKEDLTTDEVSFVEQLIKKSNAYSTEFAYNITHFARHQVNLVTNYASDIHSSDSSMPTKHAVVEAEIGLYDSMTEQFVEKKVISLSIGNITAIKVRVEFLHADDVATIEEHEMLFNMDLFKRVSLTYHTWTTSEENSAMYENYDQKSLLRVMTYNLWHNNPPSWVYNNHKERWQKYEERIRHFCEVIAEEDPDIITLQEVRLDSLFFTPNKDKLLTGSLIPPRQSGEFKKIDAGSQVEHLLAHLNSVLAERLSNSSRSFYNHIVYHPGMSMLDRQRLAYRNEEGVMILSKFPLRDVRVLFLPRNLSHPNDDHQRLVLIADVVLARNVHKETIVELSATGETDRERISRVTERETRVTVGTTHLSLLEESRDLSYEFFQKTLDAFAESDREHDHAGFVVTGDFNAEPHEQGLTQFVANTNSASSSFEDTWLAHNHASQDPSAGFTFPASLPVKRIDYILARNFSSNSAAEISVVSSHVAGKLPTKNTVHLIGSREGLGMLDKDSPTWASDHFAVVTDFRVNRKE